MSNYKLEGWVDYWNLFDQLCSTLTNNSKKEIVGELRDAQQYVNGLSDGWYDFSNHFQATISSNHSQLNQEERDLSQFLLSALKRTLNRQ